MARYKLRHQKAATTKAVSVSSYIKFYKSIMNEEPTLEKIASHFKKSTSWAQTYRTMAREMKLL